MEKPDKWSQKNASHFFVDVTISFRTGLKVRKKEEVFSSRPGKDLFS